MDLVDRATHDLWTDAQIRCLIILPEDNGRSVLGDLDFLENIIQQTIDKMQNKESSELCSFNL